MAKKCSDQDNGKIKKLAAQLPRLRQQKLLSRVVAIDIESNPDTNTIWEYGWRRLNDTGRRENPRGIKGKELQEAVDASILGLEHPCVVGHNLLAWDWKILREHGARFPPKLELWDTLLGSWLWEPWLTSYALVVDENAHRADADAKKCFELFEKQAKHFSPCLPNGSLDIRELVDRLFEKPELLDAIKGREYPAKLHSELSGPTLFPACKKQDFAWQQHCFVELLNAERRYRDPVLDPNICRSVAKEQGEIASKAIAVIVENATAHGVSVHLSWLPLWLTDKLLETLQEAHKDATGAVKPENSKLIYIAEDFFSSKEEQRRGMLGESEPSVRCPERVASAWQEVHRKELRRDQVEKRFPRIRPDDWRRRTLFEVDDDGTPSWLMYAPPGLRSNACSWYLLPPIPGWLKVKVKVKVKPHSDGGTQNIPARIPRWRDGAADRLDVDRLFVSPDTTSRRQYLAELTHIILNIKKWISEGKSERTVLLVGLRWPEESEQLQRNLLKIGVSSEHPGSALRQLESLINKGHSVLCCEIAKIPEYIAGAKRLKVDLEVAIDELPLHEWYAILESPQIQPKDTSRNTGASNDEVYSRQAEVLCPRNIRKTVETFLEGWLDGLGLTGQGPDKQCLILDERPSARHAAVAANIQRQDIPFFKLDELLLDPSTLKLFHSYCYPRREKEDIPEDYESYQKFLEANWEHKDFKPLQKPAIESILQSKKDLLLRLPTGEGKSVIFHLPALYRSQHTERLSIVITPLRALMHDQVEGLRQKNFYETVDYLSGGREPWMNHAVYQGVLDGRIHLLFIAPERMRVPRFKDVLERRRMLDGGLEFIVFDETHCVSEWGFDFRPDYLYAAKSVRTEFKDKTKDLPGNPHRLILTSATVTERNRMDLEKELGLGGPGKYDDLPKPPPHPIQEFIKIDSFDLYGDPDDPNDDKLEKACQIISALLLTRSAALVFVKSRKDCHRLSDALTERATKPDSKLGGLRARPFHAGLSESQKTESYEQLKNGEVNVLVCTKAFGMGMDIKHIHACIHHRPPTFIEDYLQEIGRVGRDPGERRESGHETVTASLLYNANDIDQNLSMLRDQTVQPEKLARFFDYCINASISFEAVDQTICLVPKTVEVSDTLKYTENQVTNCLFWLERMGVLTVEGRQPPVLKLLVRVQPLKRQAKGDGSAADIANVLLEIAEESHATTAPLAPPDRVQRSPGGSQAKPEPFKRVIRGLIGGVLSLRSKPRLDTSPPTPTPTPAETEPVEGDSQFEMGVPVRELLARSGDLSNDDLHSNLFKLVKAGAIEIKKTFLIRPREWPSEKEYFELLEHALGKLCMSTAGCDLPWLRSSFKDGLRDWYRERLAPESPPDGNEQLTKQEQWRIDREVRRAVRTSLQIMRQLRFEVKERFSNDGVAIYVRSIPTDSERAVTDHAIKTVGHIKGLSDIIEAIAPTTLEEKDAQHVPLTDIVEKLGDDVNVSDLRNRMKLLDSSGLFSFEADSEEWVSVVTINRTEPLPTHDPDREDSDGIQKHYDDMVRRFEFQERRAQAMVLLTVMPRESRKKFIDEYFKCTDAPKLKELIKDRVGDVDNDVLQSSKILKDLLARVRQERFTEEKSTLNENQLAVCQAPYDQNLLVNAGPGSGKTRVLMMRCVHLIHERNVDPKSILVLAFNRVVVSEIRERLQELFRDLGYSNYARGVDVTTFHSFALKHQKTDDRFEEKSVEEAIHTFAESLRANRDFAREIGSKYRAILIDEFQDMNEDFYSVVEALISNCRGGGLVIGDDDQDILTWNRVKWQKDHRRCPLEAVHYFERFRKDLEPKETSLTVNYRSARNIIDRADEMIERAASQIDFSRMKKNGRASLDAVKKNAISKSDCIARVADAIEKGEHVAVLCRSNRECHEIYKTINDQGLVDSSDQIELLGSEDRRLYQLRASGGLLDICRDRNHYEFVEQHVWSEMMEALQARGFADWEKDRKDLDNIYELVGKEVGRPRVRDLKKFIHEMRYSDIERLKAKNGMNDKRARLTIATVHKVKGLEYDTVIVPPSEESFPFNDDNSRGPPLKVSAAEEARLYYVAMTRAKTSLHAGWGPREQAWSDLEKYQTTDGGPHYRLKGSKKEIFLSRPGYQDHVDKGFHHYIETQVRVGDPLHLHILGYLHHGHRARTVGLISSEGKKRLGDTTSQPKLRVANVIRHTYPPDFQKRKPEYWEKLHQDVQKQGWNYVVLVEEY